MECGMFLILVIRNNNDVQILKTFLERFANLKSLKLNLWYIFLYLFHIFFHIKKGKIT